MSASATTASESVEMPRLSDGMEDGTVVRWLVPDGERVVPGQDLVEIETDKATMTYEAPAGGVLSTLVGEGETVPVGAPIALLGDDASGKAALDPQGDEPQGLVQEPQGLAQPGADVSPPARAVAGPQRAQSPRVAASPLARRMAFAAGLALESVSGSGLGGRIRRADVEAAIAARERAAGAQGAQRPPAGAAPGAAEAERVPLSRAQQVVARRMAQARATIPDFQLTVEIDMGPCGSLRGQLAETLGSTPAPSYNDMILKACALALREHRTINSSYSDGEVLLHANVNVGVAVAAPGRLVVPTIGEADARSLIEIAAASRVLVEKARAGTIEPSELSGATFTVSNLGMLGVSRFTAVVNPPQVAILAVGAIVERPVAEDGAVSVKRMLEATLSCDHRVVYGAEGAEFLASVKRRLEAPLSLLAGV